MQSFYDPVHQEVFRICQENVRQIMGQERDEGILNRCIVCISDAVKGLFSTCGGYVLGNSAIEEKPTSIDVELLWVQGSHQVQYTHTTTLVYR